MTTPASPVAAARNVRNFAPSEPVRTTSSPPAPPLIGARSPGTSGGRAPGGKHIADILATMADLKSRVAARLADLRRAGQVIVLHPFGTEAQQLIPRHRRVADERGDVDALAARRERSKSPNAFVEQHARAVMVAVVPVVEADADLEDAVIEGADRRTGVAPEKLEGLVLLEELAGVELLDAADELGRWGRLASRARVLVDRAAGDAA